MRAGWLAVGFTLVGGAAGPVFKAGKGGLSAVRRAARESLNLNLTPSLPIELNAAVLGAIDGYRGKPFFSEALSRGAQFLPAIRAIFEAEGLPIELAYVGLVESEFKPDAVSWAKARGLWQFMPKTGERFGLKQTMWVDERSNPEKAARAAAQYLSFLHRTFNDWNLALAAYNAGEGRIMRAIEKHGTNDFWELTRKNALPHETMQYVPRIHAAIVMANEPGAYGISVDPISPPATEPVELDRGIDLQLVAECIDADVDDLRRLNPELRTDATPLNRPFTLHVPEGTAAPIRACIARIPLSRRLRVHFVRRGQTLATIARRYGTAVARLAAANDIGKKQRLAKGTTLIIPSDE